MFSTIDEFLKGRLNDFVFIELKNDEMLREKGFPRVLNIPLPIPVKEVVDKVKGDTSTDIPLLKIIEGMIFILGIDSGFLHNKLYKEFLYSFNDDIDKIAINKGIKYMSEEKKIEGLICFKSSIYLNNENIDGLYNYGRCCEELSIELNDKKIKRAFEKEALKTFEEISILYPDFPLSYYHLGFHYTNQRLYKKAELIWRTFLDLNKDENREMEVLQALENIKDKIRFEEGYTLVVNGEPNKGLEILLPLSKDYPEWWNVIFFIGLAYRNIGSFERALDYFKKVLDIQPNQVDTLNEIGLCYISIGKIDESIKYFEKALKIKENDSEILSNLGMAYLEKHDLVKAEEYLNKSIILNPEDNITQKCLRKLQELRNQS